MQRIEELVNPKACLDDIVRVHMRAFDQSVLTRLGSSIVRRYYGWQCDHQQAVVFIASYDNGAMTGFCVAGSFHDALYGYLRAHIFRIAFALIVRPYLWRSPDVIQAISRGMHLFRWKRRSRLTERERGSVVPASFESGRVAADEDVSLSILSIAVDPAYQGSGVGRTLIMYAEELAIQRGRAAMQLSVREENRNAVAFYERHGYVKVVKHGRWRGNMMKYLKSQGHGDDDHNHDPSSIS